MTSLQSHCNITNKSEDKQTHKSTTMEKRIELERRGKKPEEVRSENVRLSTESRFLGCVVTTLSGTWASPRQLRPTPDIGHGPRSGPGGSIVIPNGPSPCRATPTSSIYARAKIQDSDWLRIPRRRPRLPRGVARSPRSGPKSFFSINPRSLLGEASEKKWTRSYHGIGPWVRF